MAARPHALCFLRPGPPASGKPRPRLVGPDNAGDGDPSEADFRTLLSQLPAGTLDALTLIRVLCAVFHDTLRALVIKSSCMRTLARQLKHARELRLQC